MKKRTKKKEMSYVDGYVLVVSKKGLIAYKKMAQMAGEVWMKHGALDYKECVMEDPKPWKKAPVTFAKLLKAKPSEKVFFSFIVFKNRKHRDMVNAKVMKDPFMNDPKYKDKPMPFDMNRMLYAGFTSLVDEG